MTKEPKVAEVEEIITRLTEAFRSGRYVFGLCQDTASLLTAQQDALEEARKERDEAVKQERESCAFDAECVSGFGDPWTIETIAANIRARGPEDEKELVHISRETWEALQTAKSQLAEKDREIERLKAENSALAADQCHKGYGDEYGNHRCAYQDQLSTLQKQLEEVEGHLANLVDDVDGLIAESDGVYGLHLNGDPSPWDELIPGGEFERLTSLEDARASLTPKGESNG